jgi:hypothetical protein
VRLQPQCAGIVIVAGTQIPEQQPHAPPGVASPAEAQQSLFHVAMLPRVQPPDHGVRLQSVQAYPAPLVEMQYCVVLLVWQLPEVSQQPLQL